jgi:glutathione S-transferase
MALIVYGASLSPFVRKVRVMLAEKGLDYKIEYVNPFSQPPEFADISPLKRIPVLRDTDRPEPNTLPDSSVICDYIDHKWPTPALYPAEPFERAQALWLEEYADSLVAQSIGLGLFFERVVKKLIGGECNETVVTGTIRDKLPPIFDYLDKMIGARRFLVGDEFSIADIAVASMFVNYDHAGETIDSKCWPNLSRYVAEMHMRPSFGTCVDGERRFLERQGAA